MLQPMKLSVPRASCRPLTGSGYLRQREQQCHVRIIFAAILVVLALPAGADAKPGYKVHPGGIELIVPLGEKLAT